MNDYFADFDYLQPDENWEQGLQDRAFQRQGRRDQQRVSAGESYRNFMHLPSWANPERDQRLSNDPETGYPVYMASNGTQYILPNITPEDVPEQRSRRDTARMVYEAIPPLENWRLPTREELGTAAGFVGDAAQHVLSTPTSPDASLADMWDVAGMAFTGGLAGTAPPGALRSGASRSSSDNRVPLYRQREVPEDDINLPELEVDADGNLIPYRTPVDPYDEPINWQEFGLTPPSNEWNNITYRQWDSAKYSDELPNEVLARFGIRNTDEDYNFSIDLLDHDDLTGETFRRSVTESVEITGQGIRPDGNVLATFRSPTLEVIDSLEVPKKGMRGADFLRYLERHPDVRSAEVKSMGLEIDPQRRYTREELRQAVEPYTWNVVAEMAGRQHSLYQRQQLLDNELDYEEIIVRANRGEDLPTYRGKTPTHYTNDTVAHARVTLRQDGDPELAGLADRPYLLVEELQSDLVQQGFHKPRPALSGFDQKRFREGLAEILSDEEFGFLDENLRTALEGLETLSIEKYLPNTFDLLATGTLFPDIDPSEVRNYFRHIGITPEQSGDLTDFEYTFLDNIVGLVQQSSGTQTARTAPPVTNNREFTRTLVHSLLSYAQRNGADEIVFPPFEQVVARRFTPGTDAYINALQPGSGFHRTYVTSLDEVLSELQEEFGPNMVQVGRRELPYEPTGYRSGRRRPELTETRYEQDLSELAYWQVMANETEVPIRELLDSTSFNRQFMDHLDRHYGQGWESASSVEELADLNVPSIIPLPTEGISLHIGNLGSYDLSRPRFAQGGLIEQTRQIFGEI